MYRLVFLEGPDKGRRVVVRQPAVEAGAEPDLRIHLDDPAAQEHHAVFIRDNGSVHVETSMGAQPFLRNGEPLGREPLRHGDVLELGRLRLQYQEMQPLVFHERRRTNRLHVLTVVASMAVIVLQAVLLGAVLLRVHERPLPESATHEAEPVEEAQGPVLALLPDQPAAPAEDVPKDDAREPELGPELEPEPAPGDDGFDEVAVVRPEPIADHEPTVPERPTEGAEAEPSTVEKPTVEIPDVEYVEPVRPVVDTEPPPRAEDMAAAPAEDAEEDLPRRILIGEVAREKFQPEPGYEEARGARVILRPRRSLGDINPEEVRVELTFYDRDDVSGEVAPSRVPTRDPAPLSGGAWAAGDEKDIQYRYEVPEGFRAREARARSYYGHVVRLYYRGELEDEYAFPESLLEQ